MTRLVPAWAVVLLLLGGAYQVKGNADLLFGTAPSSAIDLRGRDIEHTFFTQGQNPFDHFMASQPPWGYPLGWLLTWPPWPEVRVYFAAINGAALLFLMWWAYRAPRDLSRDGRLLLAAAVAAFGGSCTATEVGQVSILVTALLAGALMCDRAGRHAASGLLVALSLIKPTISAPFAVALIVTGRYRAAAAAAAYGAAATAATWLVTGASPLGMLQQMATASAAYIGDGTLGLPDVMAALGATSPAAVSLMPLLVAVPGVALMTLTRHSLPLAFAIAAVWGRLWTYHKSYDDVMLAFLLVPLGVLALREPRSRSALAAFAVMGVLAWLPGRALALPVVQLAQLAVWPAALFVLLRAAVRLRPHAFRRPSCLMPAR